MNPLPHTQSNQSALRIRIAQASYKSHYVYLKQPKTLLWTVVPELKPPVSEKDPSLLMVTLCSCYRRCLKSVRCYDIDLIVKDGDAVLVLLRKTGAGAHESAAHGALPVHVR